MARHPARRTRTDRDGLFEFKAVPVGTYELFLDDRPREIPDPMLARVGAVEVRESEQTWVPVVKEGTRTLSGRMLFHHAALETSDPEGFLGLSLQLRPSWDPTQVAAECDVHSREREEQVIPVPTEAQLYEMGYTDYESFVAANEKDEPIEWIIGGFTLRNLIPGIYTLRIAPADNSTIRFEHEGRCYQLELYEERTVDLTYEDLDLGLEEFTLEGFAQAAADRDGPVPCPDEDEEAPHDSR